MELTAEEFRAKRAQLAWSTEQVAAQFGVTPHVVTAWDAGTVRIPQYVAREIRWYVALAERASALEASGLPRCSMAEELDHSVVAKEGKALDEAIDRRARHGDECALCRARAEYADRHGPLLPAVPYPFWTGLLVGLVARLQRVPVQLGIPPGDRGTGRRRAVSDALTVAVLLLGLMTYRLARAGWAPDAWWDEVIFFALIPVFALALYGTGAAYDALQPVGDRFLAYLVRWWLRGSFFYGMIVLVMLPHRDEAPVWPLIVILLLVGSGAWTLAGAGIWVKDRLTRKPPRSAP